jgi:hypothetical protein
VGGLVVQGSSSPLALTLWQERVVVSRRDTHHRSKKPCRSQLLVLVLVQQGEVARFQMSSVVGFVGYKLVCLISAIRMDGASV